MTAAAKGSDLKKMAEMLANVVDKIFKGGTPPVNFAENPVITERDIIEYEGRMRVSGMGAFNGPTFISASNFYQSTKEKEENKACGAIVVYFEEESTELFLRALGHKNIDEDDEQSIMNACGEVCRAIAEQFNLEMAVDLIISDPVSFHNSVSVGIPFSYDQYQKYEIVFSVKTNKVLAVEITMSLK